MEEKVQRKYNKNILSTARMLRKNATKEENHLWYDFLQSLSLHFVRQKILGKYIVDFYCAKLKLVIEVDGSGHFTNEGIEYDEKRTEFLARYGLRVIRVSNEDINKNFKAVCEYIEDEIGRPLDH